MSIIRSNIARQLLAEGGAPRKPFARGGREDANTMSGSGYGAGSSSTDYSSFGPDQEDDNARMMSDMGLTPSVGPDRDDDDKALSYINFNRPQQNPSFFQTGIDTLSNYTPLGFLNKFDQRFLKPGRDKYNLSRRTDFLRRQGLIGPGEESVVPGVGGIYTDEFLLSPEGLDMLKGMGYTTIQDVTNKGEGGDNDPIRKIRAPITEKIEEEPELSDIENLLAYRGSAFEDGGEVRQKFGLGGIGKVFKKAKKAVSKVVKSPIGKAALFAGLGAYGLGAGPFGASGAFANAKGAGFLKSKFMKDLLLKKGKDEFTFGNLSPLSLIGIPTVASYLFSKKEEDEDETLPEVANTDPAFQNLINYMGGSTRFAAQGGDIDEAPMKDMPRQEMASYGYNDAMSDTYQMFLQMKEKDLIPPEMKFDEFLQEVVPEMSKRQGTERTMAAGGGMMNPNDEMLNLGGNEMDLRGGGFVPLGEYEKKDDVPARLSKNEFVFTADAVRAAGGGSVDRGADLMYKTMKNLENKIA